jgi:hypothetical protein
MRLIHFASHPLAWLALLVLPIAQAIAAATETVTIQVGARSFTTSKFTAKGTPVVPMWRAPLPTDAPAAGFPLLEQAEHALVWQPATRADGAYNHYAALIHYHGRFFAMWGNHPLGEDAPGQRILYAWSDAWGVWSDAQELFPAPGPVRPRSEQGIHLKADRWAIVDDTLYAIIYVHGAGRYPVARAVAPDGTPGEPFTVRDLPDGAALPSYMTGYAPTPRQEHLAAQLRQWYADTNQVSWWAWADGIAPKRGIDGADLIESFSYRAKDDGYVLFLRDWGHNRNPVHNNRLYVSFSDRLDSWTAPYPTDIPDSPSRAQALTLADGTVLLIGSQTAYAFDVPMYLDRDPLTVAISADGLSFDRVFALRTGAPKDFRFPGVSGRNPGFAYVSALIHDGWLYVLYSVGKEDMAITRVPIGEWLMANG